MPWLTIAILAYVVLALVNLADKFLLDKVLPSSKTYTFLIGLLSLLAFLLAPWFLEWPGIGYFFLNLITGALFPMALLLLYQSLKKGDASVVIPLIGGSTQIFTIILAILFLGESFSPRQWLALLFLVIGLLIISWFPSGHHWWTKVFAWFEVRGEKHWRVTLGALASALAFAVFMILSKFAYEQQTFLSGFIWIRAGSFLAVLGLLLNRASRKEISKHLKKLFRGKKEFLFLGNQALSAVGAFLQQYAVFLGSVAIVNALQGFQYALLLALGGIITVFYPKIMKENISKKMMVQKLVAVLLISIGLYFIAT
ncbi:MAG: EamA family transporter [Patescibacteria group bacterium]